MPQNVGGLILAAGIMLAVLAGITALSNYYSLNIKAKTEGHGQHRAVGHQRGDCPHLCAGRFYPRTLAGGKKSTGQTGHCGWL